MNKVPLTQQIIDLLIDCSELSALEGKSSNFNRQFANLLNGCRVNILNHKNELIL